MRDVCLWLHKWSKWGESVVEYFKYTHPLWSGSEYQSSERVQYRKCERCGKQQRRLLS